MPLLTLIFYPAELSNAKFFIIPGGAIICLGYLLALILKDKAKGHLQKHQDAVLVVSVWLIAIMSSALPFMLTGNYSFSQAVFEATSGWSTTGLTVVDVSQTPHIFLMHRSLTTFFGAIGLLLVVLSLLSDNDGAKLYNFKGRSNKMIPNLLHTLKMILAIYAAIIGAGAIMYKIYGMPWFDAFNHAITAVSTGGFSTKADSIGFYHSAPIELISIVLMLSGSISFIAYFNLLQGKYKIFFKSCEFKFTVILCLLGIPILAVLLRHSWAGSLPQAFRIAGFQFISALTTTGFCTVNSFNAWPASTLFIIILAMLTGGGSHSTAGGLKQFRVCILLKNILWQIDTKFAHKRVVKAHTVDLPSPYK